MKLEIVVLHLFEHEEEEYRKSLYNNNETGNHNKREIKLCNKTRKKNINFTFNLR